MIAAQIDPKKLYAVRINEKIYRFRVRAVESRCFRRELKPTKADYEHKVHGTLDERDFDPSELPSDKEERAKFLTRTFEPSDIAGEYEQYAELVARTKAEQAQAEADRLARVKAAKELAQLFYSLSGLPETGGYHKPISYNDYSGGVHLENVAVAALLPLLKVTSQPEPADK